MTAIDQACRPPDLTHQINAASKQARSAGRSWLRACLPASRACWSRSRGQQNGLQVWALLVKQQDYRTPVAAARVNKRTRGVGHNSDSAFYLTMRNKRTVTVIAAEAATKVAARRS